MIALLLSAALVSPITTDGLDDFKAGTLLLEVSHLLKTDTPQGNDDPFTCAIYPSKVHLKTRVMVEYGRISYVETLSPNYATASGARVGMSEKALVALYGKRLRVEKDPYGDWPRDKKYFLYSTSGNGIKFSVSAGKVDGMTAGTGQSIKYIEGCL